MCNRDCIYFGVKNLSIAEVEGKRIIEVGSYDTNGSLRPIIESWGKPAQYVGIDILKGPGVDIVCKAEELTQIFGEEGFDVVISTELLEHVRDWRTVVSNIKKVCKPNGVILITTRSKGFRYHGFPYDFWRYELDDLKTIFSDCQIENLQKDTLKPGAFLKAKKPARFKENDLTTFKLYSIIVDERVKEIADIDQQVFLFKRKLSKNKFSRPFFKLYDRSIKKTGFYKPNSSPFIKFLLTKKDVNQVSIKGRK